MVRLLEMLAALLALLALPSESSGSVGRMGAELKVVSFNVRYGTADDGENAWEHRREMVTGLLARLDADVVGLQEALRFQLDEIAPALPGYTEIGVGRDDGATLGEYSALLVREERFGIAESGTFWLSDAPEEPGSKAWGNEITRVCTWARLVERTSGRGVYVFNCHLDHKSQPSRERGAELIAARIGARAHTDEPVVLMGDFNAGEGNGAMRYLRGELPRASDAAAWPGHEPAPSPRLIDTFRAFHPDAREVGTFTGFRVGAINGEKIDHILAGGGAQVVEAGIDRTSRGGRYPSDHFPVWARLTLWEDER
ncbi:MAG TPA: endonuclease/exonuclease/phosphatase family protein [Phycisphaerales bacterium]|nr:endonuclease/exonuclease/phosphatase family protein [Phycisphaerales bacterium]